MPFTVDKSLCINCGACIPACPSSIFSHVRSQRFSIESQMFLLEKALEIAPVGNRKGGSLSLKKNTEA